MTDHTPSGACRELRTMLKAAKLDNPLVPRELRAAVPLVAQALELLEDLADRYTILESHYAALQKRVNCLDRLDGVLAFAHRVARKGPLDEQSQPLDRNLPVPDAGLQTNLHGEKIQTHRHD